MIPTKLCPKHPKYKAVVKPRAACKDCWVLYQHSVLNAFATAIEQIQKSCKHEHMVERDHYTIISTFPPARVCKDCGLAEEGWGCGYQRLRVKDEYSDALRERIPTVSKERFNTYVLSWSDKNGKF